ncbi:MAG: response regulator [Synechocystis sp.]|nr:response regulator [Synechocystis sp.]
MSLDPKPPTILVVDDVPANLAVLHHTLYQAGYQVRVEVDGTQVMDQVIADPPELILLDVMLPGISGFDLCEQLKANPQTAAIPVIFMTALANTADKVKGLGLGAVDYITKPFQQQEVLARVQLQLKLAQLSQDLAERNQALQALTDELELRVQQRTAELSASMEQLQQTQQQLEEANAELETYALHLIQTTRLKDEFLATMSHELRTPLNAILGFSELLLDDSLSPLSDLQRQGLETITQSGEHLLGLISDMLDFSQLSVSQLQLDRQPVNLFQLCQKSVELVEDLARPKGIRLSLDYPDALTPQTVELDSGRMQQILLNLLRNAVKFTPEGGEVKLAVFLQSSPSAAGDSPDQHICLAVKDTGIGIAPEQMEQLFRPFRQLDGRLNREFEGTGLGLALVKHLVELHGGTIAVESQVGQGSCFTVTLPYTGGAAAVETDPPLAPQLLIAEENEDFRTMLAGYFQNKGYRVLTALTGQMTLELWQAHQPDLSLINFQFIDLGEIDLLQRLQPLRAPVIALNNDPPPGDRQQYLGMGVSEYVSYPIKLQDLLLLAQQFVPLPSPHS